jgi:hydrogenase-1 operon protein HyaF
LPGATAAPAHAAVWLFVQAAVSPPLFSIGTRIAIETGEWKNSATHEVSTLATRPIEIPVQAVGPAPAPGALTAILFEIASMLETLIDDGEADSLDLRRAPLDAAEQRELKRLLGHGEVKATVDLLGPTEITETAIPGVWLLSHRNPAGDVIGEFIEVTAYPEMLASPAADMRAGLRTLRRKLSNGPTQIDADAVARSFTALGLRSLALDVADNTPRNDGGNADANQLDNRSPENGR